MIPTGFWVRGIFSGSGSCSNLGGHGRGRVYTLVYTIGMRDLSITDFRRQCLSLLDNLPEEGIVITKHGQPIARVAPVRRLHKGERVTLPLLKAKGRPGPLCPNTETPYDLVFG